MIDLNKKYKTTNGNEVLLYEIFEGKVFGRVKLAIEWHPRWWFSHNGKSLANVELSGDLVEVDEFYIPLIKPFTKNVEYKGNVLVGIGKTVKYITTDKDGAIWAWTTQPVRDSSHWESYSEGRLYKLGDCQYKGDWRDSLVQV